MGDLKYGVLVGFLTEFWTLFVGFAKHYGVGEDECEALIKALRQQAGR
jgi:hypothetical protein